MVITQVLRSDHSVKIRLHQFLNKVHFFEAIKGRRLNNIQDCDDLRERERRISVESKLRCGTTDVVADLVHGEMLEELELAESS